MFEVKTDLRTLSVQANSHRMAVQNAESLLVHGETMLSVCYTGPADFIIVEIESC